MSHGVNIKFLFLQMCKSLTSQVPAHRPSQQPSPWRTGNEAPENLQGQVTHMRRNLGRLFQQADYKITSPPREIYLLNGFPRKQPVRVALGICRRKPQKEDTLLPALQRQPKTLFSGSLMQHYTDNKLTHVPDLGQNPHFKMNKRTNE